METGGPWPASEASPPHLWDRRLYCRTPLVESLVLQRRHLPEAPVYLKLENTQHTGSFKLRGLSRLCQHAARTGHDTVVTSSGGNAGLAVAFSARRLGITARVYVTQRTSQSVIDTLRREGAKVIVSGTVWDDADKAARDFVANKGGFYCHPFDDPIVWSGHASMMGEVAAELLEQGFEEGPSAVVTCVGGGGLLCGVLEGMHRVGWKRVPVIAMETHGAASFRAAWDCGRPVTIDDITSLAITLGAKKVCQRVVDYIHEHPLISELVSDQLAVEACLQFADDHRMLVEPSCGATLSAIYSGLASRLYREGRLQASPRRPLVAIVCGGSAATLRQLQDWKRLADLSEGHV